MPETPPKTDFGLGLALGGGALRGIFLLGVLQALEENDIVPDVVAGTSAGSICGACWAAGRSATEIIRDMRRVRIWPDIIRLVPSFANLGRQVMAACRMKTGQPPLPGLIHGEGVSDTVARLTRNRTFSESAPLVMTSTDIRTGERVLLTSPELARVLEQSPVSDRMNEGGWTVPGGETVVPFEDMALAARASGAVPGVFTPVPIEHAGRDYLLSDGGLLEQVPVRVLQRLGCRRIIAVYIGYVRFDSSPRHAVAALFNLLQIQVTGQIAHSLRSADLALYDPRIESSSFLHFDFDLVELGYRFTRQRMEDIRRIAREAQVPTLHSA